MRGRATRVALAALLAAPVARADGAYGRLQGDVAPSVEVGAAVERARAAWLAQARLLYLSTAGLQAALAGPAGGERWSVAVGAELRPLFLGRFLKGRERGPSRLDLAIDSLGLGLAARVGPGRSPGVDLSLGFEVPLSSTFDGFFVGLHGVRRWSHEALSSPEVPSQDQAWLTLGFRGVLQTHLVDVRDQVLR